MVTYHHIFYLNPMSHRWKQNNGLPLSRVKEKRKNQHHETLLTRVRLFPDSQNVSGLNFACLLDKYAVFST